MPTIPMMWGNKAPEFVDRVEASTQARIVVPTTLRRLMAAAGVTGPHDIDKLSEEQLAKILQDKTPSQRIEAIHQIHAAGIYPRTLPTMRPVSMVRR